MNRNILILAILLVFSIPALRADAKPDTMHEILALERQAMDGWIVGNPDPTLATLDPDATYFHFPLDKRISGITAIKNFFEPYRGKSLFDSYDIVEPAVQEGADFAVLTYQLVTHNGSATGRWNCSEVYRHGKQGWKVIHAHWSKANSPAQ